MEFIDSHCHLNLDDFDEDRDEVILRAGEAGVCHIVNIGIDRLTSEAAIHLAEKHDRMSATVGHHPHEAQLLTDQDIEILKELAGHEQVVGFGEIGLDFFRNISPKDIQRKRFDDLIQAGLEVGLPLVIHDRDAHREILEHLRSARAGGNGGIIHCYSGDYDLAVQFLDMGFYISIPGTVTFPKAETVRDVVKRLPLDAMLIETDAPFLAPVPKRGRRNEPAYVSHTAREIAKIKDLEIEEVARVTTANTRKVFRLTPHSGKTP